MSLKELMKTMLPAIEAELQQAVGGVQGNHLAGLHEMLTYHMGWTGEGAGPEATGKRIRPLLVLLSCASAGGDWQKALPAAAGVELVHNFSLIHDDIEDNSPLRRGRPTVWQKWGIPQAINAGDAMFTLAHLALLKLASTTSPETALEAASILQATCLHLTEGQYLDLSYEARGDLDLEAYWPMVSGKTAALLSTCTRLGSLAAGAPLDRQQAYGDFGRLLGLAFQVQDDLLGIWGNHELTGKSAESDLISGKKSLPVLFGLSKAGSFAERWSRGSISPAEVPVVAEQLKAEGAYDYTKGIAEELTGNALQKLEDADPQGEAGQALRELAHMLLNRAA